MSSIRWCNELACNLSEGTLVWDSWNHDLFRESVFDPSSLVYLSPDGQTILETIDSTKTYVIGGFVDRSVNKVILL